LQYCHPKKGLPLRARCFLLSPEEEKEKEEGVTWFLIFFAGAKVLQFEKPSFACPLKASP